MSEYCEGLVIDLHNHSNKSDGLYSPSEVVRKAYDAGIRVFGLSDHDNVSGIDEAYAEAVKTGISLVAGVEITTPRKIHIQGLCVDIENRSLTELLETQNRKRREYTELLCRKLADVGVFIDYDDLMGTFAGTVNKYNVSQYMVNRKMVELTSPDDVYEKYFATGGLVTIKEAPWCSMTEAVETILKAGGIPVLAHVWRYFDPKKPENTEDVRRQKMHELTRAFREAGGEAMETLGCKQLNAFEKEYPTELALEFGLYASCGTDYHRDDKVPLGTRYVFDERLVPVWKHPKFSFYGSKE